MIRMIYRRGGGVIEVGEDPSVISRLMVHGFIKAPAGTPVTGVCVKDPNGGQMEVVNGIEVFDAIGDGRKILPIGEPAPRDEEAGEPKTEE
jgi:hypothetical protein